MLCREWSQTKSAETSFSSVSGALEAFLEISLPKKKENSNNGQKH